MSNDSLAEKRALYERLAHAMQSGVAFSMNESVNGDTEPKHLRVGINAAMSDHGALVGMLIHKGIIDEEEYLDAIIAGMRREIETYIRRFPDFNIGLI